MKTMWRVRAQTSNGSWRVQEGEAHEILRTAEQAEQMGVKVRVEKLRVSASSVNALRIAAGAMPMPNRETRRKAPKW